MDPSTACCPNADCPDKGQRGQRGQGNIQIHSQKERRYCCTTCGKTFAATMGTAFYRVHHPVELMVRVVTLLGHGCPPQAIVTAFGLDERTVAAWLRRTGATRRGCMRRRWRRGRSRWARCRPTRFA